MLIRLGNDHTAGTTPGMPSPATMIADNDYALGQIVEAVSTGPLWNETAIVVVEDDAQGGYDHVDSHRSICLVISPYSKRSQTDSRFYNTDSALHTVLGLLDIPPMNHFVASSSPIDCFEKVAVNGEPHQAILPPVTTIRINTESSYRAKESARIFHTYREESGPDRELADILWRDAKGARSQPQRRRNR
jgi:hypothetical protein